MMGQVIRKEVLANLLSLRFTLALLMAVVLFAVGGFAYVARYQQQSEDYWKQTNENLTKFSDNARQLYKLAFHQQRFWRQPTPLTLCAEGYERYLPNAIRSSLYYTRPPSTSGRGNFLLRRFSDIDWAFIVAVPLSFMALLFTYDSFCGEREAGTLRLMLAGSVPRYQILIGKYLGALVAFGLPLLVGLCVSLVIVVSSGKVDIAAGDWWRFLGVFLLSLLYLSVFLLLGMFVSSRVSHSVSSIVVLLLIWAGIVVLAPSFGSVVAETSVDLPPVSAFRERVLEAMRQADRDAEAGKYGKNAHEIWHEDPNNPLINPPAAARYLNTKAADIQRLWEERHGQVLAQVEAGRRFACLSPAALYQRAAETLAGTGIGRCAALYRQARDYQETLRHYLIAEDTQDPNSLHLLFDFDFGVERWGTFSKRPVDFSDVPKFQPRDPALAESLQLAMWDIGALGLFNVLLFAGSFVSFLRYDVR